MINLHCYEEWRCYVGSKITHTSSYFCSHFHLVTTRQLLYYISMTEGFFTFATSLFEIYERSGQHWPLTSPQGCFFRFSTDSREPTHYGALIVLRAPCCYHSHSNFLLLLRLGSNCGSLSCWVPSCHPLFPVWGMYKPEAFSSRGHHPDSTCRLSMTSKVASLGPFPWVCFFGSTKMWFSFIYASKTE